MIRAIELFCCSGGMAAGFRSAGIEFEHAFDADPNACSSYEKNLGHRPIQIDVRDLLRMVGAGWSPGAIDMLVADPPCTPWSRAGKRRGLDDERDLLAETVDLILALRPRAYLISNVPGLQDANHVDALRRTIGSLARFGYCVADFAQLDAAAYGVPQHRVRPFWFGHRGGPCIRWPEPTHGPLPGRRLTLPGLLALRPWVTCRDALGHLPLEELGRPVTLRWKAYDTARGGHLPSSADRPARTVTKNANGDGTILAHPRHPGSSVDEPSRCVTASGTGGSMRALVLEPSGLSRSKRDPSPRGPQSSRIGDPERPAPTMDVHPGRVGQGANHVLAWPWDLPSTTVTADARLAPPGHHPESGSILSQPNAIVLTERAAAILQGLPDTWMFCGVTKAARWAQIGMAMPPTLAAAVARSVRRALEAA